MTWKPCGTCRRAGLTERCTDADCAHRVTPETQEIDMGASVHGIVGAMYRLMARGCDWREVGGWLNSEILRGTSEGFILDTIAALVSSAVLQVAGKRRPSMVRETSKRLMSDAANVIDRDLKVLLGPKSVLHNHLSVVPKGIEPPSA